MVTVVQQDIQFFIFMSILLAAALYDLHSYRIPNFLTTSAIGFGFLMNTILMGWFGFIVSIEGLGLGTALFFGFYLLKGMGAGDIKLIGAIGSMLGPSELLKAITVIALLGGFYALFVMFQHCGFKKFPGHFRLIPQPCSAHSRLTITVPEVMPRLRYGLVISLGTVLSQLAGFRVVAFG
jgi:prepilin peptidase CpaA